MAEAVLTMQDIENYRREQEQEQSEVEDPSKNEDTAHIPNLEDPQYTQGYVGEVWNINGIPFYTTQEFARIINMQTESVRQLTYRGNQIRRLKFMKIGQQIFIPCLELEEYSFTTSGGGFTTYHYDKQGELIVE